MMAHKDRPAEKDLWARKDLKELPECGEILDRLDCQGHLVHQPKLH